MIGSLANVLIRKDTLAGTNNDGWRILQVLADVISEIFILEDDLLCLGKALLECFLFVLTIRRHGDDTASGSPSFSTVPL